MGRSQIQTYKTVQVACRLGEMGVKNCEKITWELIFNFVSAWSKRYPENEYIILNGSVRSYSKIRLAFESDWVKNLPSEMWVSLISWEPK